MPAPNTISPNNLLRLIGTPDCPVLIDVCLEDDFALDPVVIPTARRMSHGDPDAILEIAQGRKAVVICQKGRKLSQGVASYLRSRGIAAEALAGGMHAWRELHGAPVVPASVLPPKTDSGSLWVTRSRPKIDRVACPWLIRRFVDRYARFLFVGASEVAGVAHHMNAIPFDSAEAELSHQGESCTFDAMLDRFGLRTAALDALSNVVRAADNGRPKDHPVASGLLAVSVGLSRQYRDDHQQIEAGMAIYDALYRWARDAQEERHAWDEERL